MDDFISGQFSTDGSFYLTQTLDEVNMRLKKDGRHGKTCQLKRSGHSITLQFNFQGQKERGCGCKFTAKGIERAEQIAKLVTTQLIADNFSFDWYDRLLKKNKKIEKIENLSFTKELEEYKKNWFKEKQKIKYPQRQWRLNHHWLEKVAQENDNPFDENTIKKIVDLTIPDSPSRRNALNTLYNFCDYFDKEQYFKLIEKLKKKNNPVKIDRYKPDDREIEFIFHHGFEPSKRTRKQFHYRLNQWQFLYSLLAIYGLRIHEAWNIANWDKPVTIKNKEWIVVDSLDEGSEIEVQRQERNLIVPAILDPSNQEKLLCIKHNTKTGYRIAMPLSPQGKNWIEEFGIIQPMNLPDIPRPLALQGDNYGSFNCTADTCGWFLRRKYGFTPHALRHAYNHRGHYLGYVPMLLAQSLGHKLNTNSLYTQNISDIRKLEGFKEAIAEQSKKQNRLEELEIENIQLKAKIELLEAKLALIQQQRSGNL
ncbi:MAG: hypothetical protein ACRC2R_16925 [Xenococcaceae cyanobacterium]